MTDDLFSEGELRDLAQLAIIHFIEAYQAGHSPDIFASTTYTRFNYDAVVRDLQDYADGRLTAADFLDTNFTLNGLDTRSLVSEFVRRFFKNIRDAVCGDGASKSAKAADLSAKGVATALASSIVSGLGSSNALAIGITAVSLIVIGGATKSAFCGMTQEEVIKAVQDKPN